MEILFIGPFGLFPKQTVSGRALPLAQALVQQGHYVRLLIPPWDHPEDSGRRFTLDGVSIEHIALPRRLLLLSHALMVWRLLWPVLASRPDIVHIFKPKGYSGIVGLILWSLRRLGIINSKLFMDTDDWEGPGGWNDRGGYGRLARWVFARQERWGLRCCDVVTAASKTLQNLAWSVGARQVHYLPNGLSDLPVLPSQEQAKFRLGLGDGVVALVYTRFVEINPKHLALILADLLARAPALQILIVGEGFRDELAQMRRRIQNLPEAHHIHLAGWVSRPELPWYWAAADLALYPCDDNLLTRSKSPLRLVEMMAAGLPVVAHRAGETEQYLENGVTGLLVEPGDDGEFVESAAKLVPDDSLRNRLGGSAMSRVTERFTWRRLARQLEIAYKNN